LPRPRAVIVVRLMVKALGVAGAVLAVQMILALRSLEMGVLTVFPYVAYAVFAALLLASIFAMLS